MYYLRLDKGGGRDRTYPPCAYYEKTRVTEESVAAQNGTPIGLFIELCPSREVIHLPSDGYVVYVMNDRGDTIEHIKWIDTTKEGGDDGDVGDD